MKYRLQRDGTSTIRRLYGCTSTTLLLLALFGIIEDAYSSSTPMQTAEMLRQVVVAHYSAIGNNQLDQAMHYFHSHSPELAETKKNIEYGLTQFLLKTTTLRFCYTGRKGESAVAAAKHKYLMISGTKFIEQTVDTEYQLRKEQGYWKIWSQRKSKLIPSYCRGVVQPKR